MSLDSLEKFIKANSHLPEIPSQQTVSDSGVNVNEMLTLQMKKIEELTLYVIELKKQNDLLAKKVEEIRIK